MNTEQIILLYEKTGETPSLGCAHRMRCLQFRNSEIGSLSQVVHRFNAKRAEKPLYQQLFI